MRTSFALRGALVAVVLSASALSCELSSTFLSESERSSLYAVKLSVGNATLGDGSYLSAGASITASVSKLTGASNVALLDISLAGTSVAQRIASSSAKGVASDDSTVTFLSTTDVEGSFPALSLPEDLSPGAYRVSLKLSSAEGRALQDVSLVVFVGLAPASIDSVAVYPPSIEPGQAILLSVTPKGEGDPWIRWCRDGAAFAQGLRSKGYDRVVWTAPKVEGAYSLSVEAFPAAPPDSASFPFESSARQEFKAMVKATADGAADEFADPLKFLSLLRFDGNFEDAGVRPREGQPVSFGSPSLDIYPSIPGYQSGFGKLGGFGYLFGETSGVRVPGLMPPISEGKSAPFAALFRLFPAASTGYLLRFASPDGAYLLELGLEEGKPYVSLLAGGQTARSVAPATVSAQPRTLVAYLRPGEESTLVTWNIEGDRVEAPPLPPLPAPPKGDAIIGGQSSLAGVYDAFGLMSPVPPPSYRLASDRRWKGCLAEAFEDGLLPAMAATKGKVSVAVGSVTLSDAASLSLGESFSLERPMILEAELSGDLASLSLAVEDGQGGRLFSATATGIILDASGASLGSLPILPEGKLAFLLTPSGDELLVSSQGKRGSVAIKAESLAGPYTLSLVRKAQDGSSLLSRVLVHESTAAR